MKKNENGEWLCNKGEWTELYVFLKLLAQGEVQAISDDLEQVENIWYPIVKIMREEPERKLIDYVINDKRVMIVEVQSGEITTIDRSVIKEWADYLLKEIKKKREKEELTNGGFELPEIEDFAKSIKVTKPKADSDAADDIFIQIDDTHFSHDLGFSIKSYIGTTPTLVNASQTTNFVYKVKGLTCEQAVEINEIKGNKPISDRMTKIREYRGKLSFDGRFGNEEKTETFKRNLTIVDEDGDMPEILADMLLDFYTSKCEGGEVYKKCKTLIERVGKCNTLDYGDMAKYEDKFKKFLCACALGMKPTKPWDGKDKVNGGFIFVTKGGNILAYRINDDNRKFFKQYLLDNTELDTASTSDKKRYNFMKLYEENGEMFINLNLKVRLMNLQLKGLSEE